MTPLSSEKEAAVNTGLFAERDANDARFGPVKHILTHRRMTAYFEVVQNPPTPKMPGRWVDVSSGDANWPRLIDKVLPELRAWIVKNWGFWKTPLEAVWSLTIKLKYKYS